MDETKQAILNIVDQAGGSVPYRQVYESLPENQRANLPKAMKMLKAEGVAMNQNRVGSGGTLSFDVFRIQR